MRDMRPMIPDVREHCTDKNQFNGDIEKAMPLYGSASIADIPFILERSLGIAKHVPASIKAGRDFP